jgi:magnesium-transporting ATPase (P-type)
MSTIVTGYQNQRDLLLKGAPDRVLAKCTHYRRLVSGGDTPSHSFTGDEKNKLL